MRVTLGGSEHRNFAEKFDKYRNMAKKFLRRKHAFNVPFCKTKRLMISFIMHNAAIF